MIEIGTYFRTIKNGEFKAGQGNVVCIVEVGEGYLLARDKQGTPYIAKVRPEDTAHWNEFIVSGFSDP
jgi:hypothetical protein